MRWMFLFVCVCFFLSFHPMLALKLGFLGASGYRISLPCESRLRSKNWTRWKAIQLFHVIPGQKSTKHPPKIVIQSHLSHLVKTSSIKKHQTRRKAIWLAHSHLSHVQNPPHLPSAAQSILEGHGIHPNLGSTAEWCLTHWIYHLFERMFMGITGLTLMALSCIISGIYVHRESLEDYYWVIRRENRAIGQ